MKLFSIPPLGSLDEAKRCVWSTDYNTSVLRQNSCRDIWRGDWTLLHLDLKMSCGRPDASSAKAKQGRGSGGSRGGAARIWCIGKMSVMIESVTAQNRFLPGRWIDQILLKERRGEKSVRHSGSARTSENRRRFPEKWGRGRSRMKKSLCVILKKLFKCSENFKED